MHVSDWNDWNGMIRSWYYKNRYIAGIGLLMWVIAISPGACVSHECLGHECLVVVNTTEMIVTSRLVLHK